MLQMLRMWRGNRRNQERTHRQTEFISDKLKEEVICLVLGGVVRWQRPSPQQAGLRWFGILGVRKGELSNGVILRKWRFGWGPANFSRTCQPWEVLRPEDKEMQRLGWW